MIFGFNTDIKHGDTVYHVQSEARRNELLLQTQVFVRGRCMWKKATPYTEKASKEGFTEERLHELLKTQHRAVLDAIREGRVESVFAEPTPADQPSSQSFEVEWLNSDRVYQNGSMMMKFRITAGGNAVAGAKLVSRLSRAGQSPLYAQGVTDATGTAEMRIACEERALEDAALLVQTTYGEKSATRKFRLRKGRP